MDPAPRPPPPDVQSILVRLRDVAHTLQDKVRERLAPDGLGFPHMLALRALFAGPKSHGQLAQSLGVTKGSLTPIVQRLEAEGLVTRQRDNNDRRITWITPTAAARAKKRAIEAHMAGLVGPVFADWSPGDLTAFAGYLDRFLAGLHGT